jgi:hypothetical protein
MHKAYQEVTAKLGRAASALWPRGHRGNRSGVHDGTGRRVENPSYQ